VQAVAVREAMIEGELYRHLKNLIETGKASYENVAFRDVERQKPIKTDGSTIYADLVVSDSLNQSWLVIETKRVTKHGFTKILDPYSQDVIEQAQRYAIKLGAPFFATTNGRVLVLFQTFQQFVLMSQRRRMHFELSKIPLAEFSDRILREIVDLQKGTGKWLDVDEAFIARMRALHDAITPIVLTSLTSKLSTHSQFQEEYRQWLEQQGWKFSLDTHERIASMAAHLLINKVLFYKILETYNPSVTRLKKIDPSTADFTAELRRLFKAIVDDIDYKSVYQETFYDKIPIPPELLEIISNFVEELSLTDLRQIKSDVIGTMYELLIPTDERKALGQYYTPPQIVEFITRMCILKPTDLVVDPCCGSGGFLVKSYHRLLDLKAGENPLLDRKAAHADLLKQVHGVEINQFPAHLSTINLAIQHVQSLTNEVRILTEDFFEVRPDYYVNAVVANPPYIRQEDIVDKDKKLAWTLKGVKGVKIDGQSDIYVYFFIHSSKFLNERGRMGYITSDKWLEVRYGEQLQRFFLDNFKVISIISFDSGVFEEADVNTCVTILEKSSSQIERDRNQVKFIRLKSPIPIDKLVHIVSDETDDTEDESLRVRVIRQEELREEIKWSLYLKAPRVFWKIVSNQRMTALGRVARVRRGITTGMNEFFILDKKQVARWGIEKHFVVPAITSPEKHMKIAIDEKGVSEYFFMVNEPKSNIEGTHALTYIELGEKREFTPKQGKKKDTIIKGYHNAETVKGRERWYGLGRREPSPIVIPRRSDLDWRCNWNRASALTLDVFYNVYPLNKQDTHVLLGYLNSVVTHFLTEQRGRAYALGVLEIEAYELKRFPILDPAGLSGAERKKIVQSLQKLVQAQERDEDPSAARRQLDKAVFECLGLDENEQKEVYDKLIELQGLRRGREKKVLVETGEVSQIKSPKRKRAEKSEAPTAVLAKWFPRKSD